MPIDAAKRFSLRRGRCHSSHCYCNAAALLDLACEVPLFALFALKVSLDWRATNSNNAKGGTCVVEAATRSQSALLLRAPNPHRATVLNIKPASEGGTMSDETPVIPKAPKLTLTSEIGLGHYSNFVSIAHNFSEVLLDFGRTLPGREDIPVVARIIMNPFQTKQLLRALSHNVQMYESNFGPIPDPPEGAAGSPASGTN